MDESNFGEAQPKICLYVRNRTDAHSLRRILLTLRQFLVFQPGLLANKVGGNAQRSTEASLVRMAVDMSCHLVRAKIKMLIRRAAKCLRRNRKRPPTQRTSRSNLRRLSVTKSTSVGNNFSV